MVIWLPICVCCLLDVLAWFGFACLMFVVGVWCLVVVAVRFLRYFFVFWFALVV